MKKNIISILSALFVLSICFKAESSLEQNNAVHSVDEIKIEQNLKPVFIPTKIQYSKEEFLDDQSKLNELEKSLSNFGFEFNIQTSGQYYLLQWSNKARVKELILGDKTNIALRTYANAVDSFVTKYKDADLLLTEDQKLNDAKLEKKLLAELEAKGDFSAKAFYLLVTN